MESTVRAVQICSHVGLSDRGTAGLRAADDTLLLSLVWEEAQQSRSMRQEMRRCLMNQNKELLVFQLFTIMVEMYGVDNYSPGLNLTI